MKHPNPVPAAACLLAAALLAACGGGSSSPSSAGPAAPSNPAGPTVAFGDRSAPGRTAAAVRYEPRMTGITVTLDAGYNPYAAGGATDRWTAVPTEDAAYREVSASFEEGSGRIQLQPAPVLYDAADKPVVASDPHLGHFPARGLVIRSLAASLRANADGFNADGYVPTPLHRLRIQGRRPKLSSADGATPVWGNWNATAYTTFRYDPAGGLTMGFGGDGVIYSDLGLHGSKGGYCPYLGADAPAVPCDDVKDNDIEISFGAPGRDPVVEAGEPGTHYWIVQGEDPRVLSPENEADPVTKAWQARAYVDYELVLSNYAGRRTAAGAHRFLEHAAYGLFVSANGIGDVSDQRNAGVYPQRTQAFYYGKDAFGPGRPVRGVETEITARFEGRTHGWILNPRAGGFPESSPPKMHDVAYDDRHTRIRGDVRLTAHIGGASPRNAVTGAITNLEHAVGASARRWTDATGRYWHERGWDHDGDPGTPLITLNNIMKGAIHLSADIDDNGAFSGRAAPGDFIDGRERGNGAPPPIVWDVGEFEGGLYGPLDDLEAAGTWWVPAGWFHRDVEAMVGSFGAVCTESSNGGAGACPAAP